MFAGENVNQIRIYVGRAGERVSHAKPQAAGKLFADEF
jgi:hypothetical protein